MSENTPTRSSDRPNDIIRPTQIELDVQRNAAASVIISTGHTRVLCAASLEEQVPRWMRDSAGGWVTAEYSMLPGSGSDRVSRRRPNSRATEIQRLIGRSLRSAIDLKRLPPVTITLDCDVIDADGGTRTASITGAWVALYLVCERLVERGSIESNPLVAQVAATSVGVVYDQLLLDLNYTEDRDAQVDMNVVGSAAGRLIEVQGTAEGLPFSRQQLNGMLDLAQAGIGDLARAQRQALGLPDGAFSTT